MARHAERAGARTRAGARRRLVRALPVALIALLLIGAAVLGVWWWNIRSVTDPIDADPVDAYAVVVSSPPCSTGDQTTVQISGQTPPVTAQLSGCGFIAQQRLAVQYLAGHPQQVRLSGTSVAGVSGLSDRLLPLGILAAGLVAVLAAVALVVDRRRSRHLVAANRVTVADLRSRAAPPVADAPGGPTGAARPLRNTPPPEGSAGGDDDLDVAVGEGDPGGPGRVDPAGGNADPGDLDTEGVDRAGFDLALIDSVEPAHLLPSGYVIVDEQLFTHGGGAAPVEPDRQPD